MNKLSIKNYNKQNIVLATQYYDPIYKKYTSYFIWKNGLYQDISELYLYLRGISFHKWASK